MHLKYNIFMIFLPYLINKPEIEVVKKRIFSVNWKLVNFDYRIRVIATPSWIEPQETYFGRTLVIFGEKLAKITVFLDENWPKLATVRSLKIKKINRTPGLQWRGYGMQKS